MIDLLSYETGEILATVNSFEEALAFTIKYDWEVRVVDSDSIYIAEPWEPKRA